MRGRLNSVSFFGDLFKRFAASAVQQMRVAVTNLAPSKRLLLDYADAARKTRKAPAAALHVATARSSFATGFGVRLQPLSPWKPGQKSCAVLHSALSIA